MTEKFIGEIKLFAGDFPPKDYAFCQGQLIQISQNRALFNIIGTTYGGDGVNNFALPNLTGRLPMGVNVGGTTGRSPRKQGTTGGDATIKLSNQQFPAHNHSISAVTDAADNTSSTGAFPGSAPGGRGQQPPLYSAASGEAMPLNAQSLLNFGPAQPYNNMQAYLPLNFIIALSGMVPPPPDAEDSAPK